MCHHRGRRLGHHPRAGTRRLSVWKSNAIIGGSRQLVHCRERGNTMRPRLMIAVLCVTLIIPGTGLAATLIVRDNFEDGTLNKWHDPKINIVNFNAGANAFSGSRVARGCWGDGSNIILRRFFDPVNSPEDRLTEIYLRYRIRYETGFDWSDFRNQNNKHVRIRTAATPNGFFHSLFTASGVLDRGWIADGSVINSGEPIPDQFGADFTPETDRWYLYEFYFKLNTGGAANGSGFVRVNGQTHMSFSGITFRTDDSVFYEELVFPNNNGGFTVTGRDCVQIDDVELWSGDPTADMGRSKPPTDVTGN